MLAAPVCFDLARIKACLHSGDGGLQMAAFCASGGWTPEQIRPDLRSSVFTVVKTLEYTPLRFSKAAILGSP
jgi:hypothetical protein